MIKIEQINNRLSSQYGVTINLGEVDAFMDDLRMVLDNDFDTLYELNHACSYWVVYLQDIMSLLSLYLDQFVNVLDVYNYLDSISTLDPDQFDIIAPKYKINTRNRPIAIKELESKMEDTNDYIKSLKLLISKIDSYIEFITANYYRTSKLMYSTTSRLINSDNY